MEAVRANGLDIAYERAGEGPPLVLVHGAAEDSRVWSPQLAALADELTVIAWDEPGAGRSSDLPPGFGLADYAHCLAALMAGRDRSPRRRSAPASPARARCSPRRPTTSIPQLPLMAGADQRDLLPRIEVPTLLVWGERDVRSPLHVARQFQDAIPDAQLVVIPGAGHLSHLEQPERFNAAVRAFCRARARAAG